MRLLGGVLRWYILTRAHIFHASATWPPLLWSIQTVKVMGNWMFLDILCSSIGAFFKDILALKNGEKKHLSRSIVLGGWIGHTILLWGILLQCSEWFVCTTDLSEMRLAASQSVSLQSSLLTCGGENILASTHTHTSFYFICAHSSAKIFCVI